MIKNADVDFFHQILSQEDTIRRILDCAMSIKRVARILKAVNSLERVPTQEGKNFGVSVKKHRNMLQINPSRDGTMKFFENQCNDDSLFLPGAFGVIQDEISSLFSGSTDRAFNTSPGRDVINVSLKKMLQFASRNRLRVAPPIVNTMNSTVAISVLLAFYLNISNQDKDTLKPSYKLSSNVIDTLTSANTFEEWETSTRNSILGTPKRKSSSYLQGTYHKDYVLKSDRWYVLFIYLEQKSTNNVRRHRSTVVAHLPNLCAAKIRGKRQNAYHICCLVEEAGCSGYSHTIVYFDPEDKPHKYTQNALSKPMPGPALPLDTKQIAGMFNILDWAKDNRENGSNSDTINNSDKDNSYDNNNGNSIDTDRNDNNDSQGNDSSHSDESNSSDSDSDERDSCGNDNNHSDDRDDNNENSWSERQEKGDGKRCMSERDEDAIVEVGTSKKARFLKVKNNNDNNASGAHSIALPESYQNSGMLTRLKVKQICSQ